MIKAADPAHQIGASAVQIFTDNPTAWRRRAELPAELDEFRRRLADHDIGPIAVHAPYLVNLAGGDPTFWERSVATMVSELTVAAAYGARFVNVHVGSHRGIGRDEGLQQVVRALQRILDEAASQERSGERMPLLVLENSAGTGDGIGSSIEDLAHIVEIAARMGMAASSFGFCLDSAHLWAAGYSIDSSAGVATVVERIDQLLGRDRIVMLHLNDAQTQCGSRIDRHQHIGAGTIGATGLAAVLTHPWLATLPTYLETPAMELGYDAINLERCRMLLAGEPLPTLPEAAFHLSRRALASAPAAGDVERATTPRRPSGPGRARGSQRPRNAARSHNAARSRP